MQNLQTNLKNILTNVNRKALENRRRPPRLWLDEYETKIPILLPS